MLLFNLSIIEFHSASGMSSKWLGFIEFGFPCKWVKDINFVLTYSWNFFSGGNNRDSLSLKMNSISWVSLEFSSLFSSWSTIPYFSSSKLESFSEIFESFSDNSELITDSSYPSISGISSIVGLNTSIDFCFRGAIITSLN